MRSLRFSLSSALCAIAMLGIILACCSYWMMRTRKTERNTIAALESRGAVIANDSRGFATQVTFDGARISRDAALEMTQLSGITELRLRHCRLGEGAIELVAKIHGLKVLDLWGTPISDDDLRSFYDHPTLRFVNLVETGTTDSGTSGLLRMNPGIEIRVE